MLLSITLQNLKKVRFDTFKMLNTSLYVNDLYSGSNSVKDALSLSITAVNILKEVSVTLRKFESKSETLR